MKDNFQYIERRDNFIKRFVLHHIGGRHATKRDYSMAVREFDQQFTAPDDRLIPWHHSADAYQYLTLDTQLVMRVLNGDVKFMVHWEECLIGGLPADVRMDLLLQLAQRFGQYVVDLPASGDLDLSNIATLLAGFSKAVEAYSPLLADNVINSDDKLNDLLAAQARTRQVLSVVTAFDCLISDAIKDKGNG